MNSVASSTERASVSLGREQFGNSGDTVEVFSSGFLKASDDPLTHPNVLSDLVLNDPDQPISVFPPPTSATMKDGVFTKSRWKSTADENASTSPVSHSSPPFPTEKSHSGTKQRRHLPLKYGDEDVGVERRRSPNSPFMSSHDVQGFSDPVVPNTTSPSRRKGSLKKSVDPSISPASPSIPPNPSREGPSGMRGGDTSSMERASLEFVPERHEEITEGTSGLGGSKLCAPEEEEEEICGICLEKPPEEGFVRLWCCNNILCVKDAQHIGRCPFCRTEPLIWDIEK